MLKLFTDTDCDVTPEIAAQYGYGLISMPYSFGDQEFYPYESYEVFDAKDFYGRLRKGEMPKTCAISPEKYVEYFEPEFKKGNDILYVHFSPAMSGTFNALNLALDQLKETYPERKVHLINTKAISILALAIVRDIGEMHLAGKSLEEILKWAETEIDKYALYYYVDDLTFFRRSGRVGNISGIVGNIFDIHPIIHIDSQGVMTSMAKSRGKITTIKKIISLIKELQEDISNHRVIIAHTDIPEVRDTFMKMLKEEFGELDIEEVIVNPTIGAHCGPHCAGVCFHAKHRYK